jgi:hypothetical protein
LPFLHAKGGNLGDRTIEVLIGRLITDEQFRSEFLSDPGKTLLALSDRGLDLSGTEISALLSTDPTHGRERRTSSTRGCRRPASETTRWLRDRCAFAIIRPPKKKTLTTRPAYHIMPLS